MSGNQERDGGARHRQHISRENRKSGLRVNAARIFQSSRQLIVTVTTFEILLS